MNNTLHINYCPIDVFSIEYYLGLYITKTLLIIFKLLILPIQFFRSKPAISNNFGLLVVFFTSALITIKTSLIVEVSAHNGTTTGNFIKSLTVCDEKKFIPKRKNVIIRIDDIQKGAYENITYLMINTALAKNIPLTLGIIPQGISEDDKLINFLKNNKCYLEIALHGYTHDEENPEFENLSFEKADLKIQQGLKELSQIDNEIVTFIPPQNIYSKGTLEALTKNGIRILSDEGSGQYDYSTTTFDFDENHIVPFNEVVIDCMAEFADNNICIIMVHPQDYLDKNGVINLKKFENYTRLLDTLKFQNASFIRFKDIVYSNLGL